MLLYQILASSIHGEMESIKKGHIKTTNLNYLLQHGKTNLNYLMDHILHLIFKIILIKT